MSDNNTCARPRPHSDGSLSAALPRQQCLVVGVPFSFDWTPARRAAILWSKRGIRHRNITFNFHWKVSSGNQKVRMCTYSRSWALSLWKSRFCFYWQFRFVRKTDEVNRENIELPTVSKENYWPSRISWASVSLELHKLQGPGSRHSSKFCKTCFIIYSRFFLIKTSDINSSPHSRLSGFINGTPHLRLIGWTNSIQQHIPPHGG